MCKEKCFVFWNEITFLIEFESKKSLHFENNIYILFGTVNINQNL